jgi:hypothetical protein
MQKFISTLFFVLLIICITELFYLFIYLPKHQPTQIPSISSQTSNKTPNLTLTPQAEPFFAFNVDVLHSANGEQIREIVTDQEKNKYPTISYVDLLNVLAGTQSSPQNCPTRSCFNLENNNDGWKANNDTKTPVTFKGSILVKVAFNSKKGPSGISLTGKLGEYSKTLWWKNIDTVFFGIGNDGHRLYIDAKNNRAHAYFLYDNTFNQKIDGIYILFNDKGMMFLVTDLSFNRIAFIDINKLTDNSFLEGLFPNRKLYVGFSIAPQSDLDVSDFSILRSSK